jgi:signal transduction histidine kinase
MATPAYRAGTYYAMPDSSVCAFPVADDPIFDAWVREGRTAPELIPDTSLDLRWLLLGSKDQPYITRIRCYLGVPVVIDGQLVAALCLGNFAPASFDALAVTAAADFADRLARALRNARLYSMELQANARLQAVLRLQDDFVATISHELRTPLTSILGFAENLTTFWPIMDEKRRLAGIERIHNAGMRLDRLVRDLLQLARTDPDALRLAPRPLVLGGLIAQAVGEITAKYPDQDIQVDPAIEHATLWADPDRLIQVLVNLLDNAAKHSPIGQSILVEWEQEDGWCTLSVSDRGRGIQPGDVQNLFRRFGKIDTVVRAGYVGTGLGLYICKQLTEAMGGAIWYEPGPAGTGSRFRVRLPLAQQALHDLPSSVSVGFQG